MSLQDISIKIDDGHSVGNVDAILNEIVSRLNNFVATARPA